MNKKFKVLHIFPSFEIGGSQRRTIEIIKGSMSGFQHSIVSLNGHQEASRLLPGGAATITSATTPATTSAKNPHLSDQWLPKNLLEIRKYLKFHRPDLMITYNWGSIDWIIANSFRPICPVIHIQDGFGEDEKDHELMRRKWARTLFYKTCRYIITPSKQLENIVLNHWRVSPKNIAYIPNGIDIEKFSSQPSHEHFSKLGINSSDRLIGTVAALRPEKRIDRLIHAFATIADEYPSVRLIIIGDGPERADLIDLAASTGLKERIFFTGSMDDPSTLLGAFTLFALSSHTEQMPVSIVEAMAAGLPIVSTDVGDISDMVSLINKDFIKGRTTDSLADNLGRALSDSASLSKIGQENQMKAAAEYDKSAMVQAYEDLFLRAIGERTK